MELNPQQIDLRIHGKLCRLYRNVYSYNSRLSLIFYVISTGEMMSVVTSNLVEEHLLADEVFMDVNNCGHEVKKLIEMGVISPPLRHIRSGYVMYPACRVLINIGQLPFRL